MNLIRKTRTRRAALDTLVRANLILDEFDANKKKFARPLRGRAHLSTCKTRYWINLMRTQKKSRGRCAAAHIIETMYLVLTALRFQGETAAGGGLRVRA